MKKIMLLVGLFFMGFLLGKVAYALAFSEYSDDIEIKAKYCIDGYEVYHMIIPTDMNTGGCSPSENIIVISYDYPIDSRGFRDTYFHEICHIRLNSQRVTSSEEAYCQFYGFVKSFTEEIEIKPCPEVEE